jgi:hypothetical protein
MSSILLGRECANRLHRPINSIDLAEGKRGVIRRGVASLRERFSLGQHGSKAIRIGSLERDQQPNCPTTGFDRNGPRMLRLSPPTAFANRGY